MNKDSIHTVCVSARVDKRIYDVLNDLSNQRRSKGLQDCYIGNIVNEAIIHWLQSKMITPKEKNSSNLNKTSSVVGSVIDRIISQLPKHFCTVKQMNYIDELKNINFRYLRSINKGPEYIKLGNRNIIYNTDKLIEWLKENLT